MILQVPPTNQHMEGIVASTVGRCRCAAAAAWHSTPRPWKGKAHGRCSGTGRGVWLPLLLPQIDGIYGKRYLNVLKIAMFESIFVYLSWNFRGVKQRTGTFLCYTEQWCCNKHVWPMDVTADSTIGVWSWDIFWSLKVFQSLPSRKLTDPILGKRAKSSSNTPPRWGFLPSFPGGFCFDGLGNFGCESLLIFYLVCQAFGKSVISDP